MSSRSPIIEYISSQPMPVAKRLRALYKTVKEIVPGADESISYGIPTFKVNGKFVAYIAGFKDHVSLYPYSEGMGLSEKDIDKYRKGKGTLRFGLDEKIPPALVKRFVKYWLKARTGKERKKK